MLVTPIFHFGGELADDIKLIVSEIASEKYDLFIGEDFQTLHILTQEGEEKKFLLKRKICYQVMTKFQMFLLPAGPKSNLLWLYVDVDVDPHTLA